MIGALSIYSENKIRPKNMKGSMMNSLKLALCGTVAVFAFISPSANAEGWRYISRYDGFHPEYEFQLSKVQELGLRNYSQYEQREPCQNYKILPDGFYRDGCVLYYRYQVTDNVSIQKTVLASYVIEFAFDSAAIESESEPVLTKIANEINRYQPDDVVISGYTDSHGTTDYNLKLSQERANAISIILTARGVPNRIIGSHAFGETNQAVETDDGVALRANRRVIVEFLK